MFLYLCGRIKHTDMSKIVGREREIEELNELYQSDKAEFVAIYGRRRVGKTFLVKEVFQDKMSFYHSGLSPYDKERKITMRANWKPSMPA